MRVNDAGLTLHYSAMTLTELKYIFAVARIFFGRGTKACYVAQPTLSVAIKKP